MKKKIYLDIILLVIILLLMNYSFTGGLLHEFLGIFVFFLFIWHNVKNWKWINAITKNIIKGKVNSKILLNYIVDIILWMSLILTTISGILISQSLFVFMNSANQSLWYLIHVYASYIFLGIIFLHIFLHSKMITIFIQKNYNVENKKNLKFILLFIFFFVIFIGFKELFNKLNTKDSEISSETTGTYSSDNSSSSSEATYSTPSDSNPPSLDEYLSERNCSSCHKHCALNALRCGRGQGAKTTATNEYYEMYGNE